MKFIQLKHTGIFAINDNTSSHKEDEIHNSNIINRSKKSGFYFSSRILEFKCKCIKN